MSDVHRRKVRLSKPLPRYLLRTFEAYLPFVLGVTDDEHQPLVRAARDRLDAYVQSVPAHEPNVRRSLRDLLIVAFMHGTLLHGKAPWSQSDEERREYVERLYHSDARFMDQFLDRVGPYLPGQKPTIRDLAKSLREMMGLAFYSNPQSDRITGFSPVWERAEHWRDRPDVDTTRLPGPTPPVFDPKAVAAVHYRGHPYEAGRLFKNDGRPKVAVIGSGAGGAVAAARLAQTGQYDVAIFESGPRLRPAEYPLDTLVGMSQLFEDGLMTLSENLDIHLLRGRVVGGGTVMTSGLSVRLRPRTFAAFTDGQHPDTYTGIDAAEFHAAFDKVQARQSLGTIAPDLYTDVSDLLNKGAARVDDVRWRFDQDIALNNVMMSPGQGGRRLDQNGDYCLGCGMCNYGCHFGHKLSMDLTYLLDFEAAGGVIHANLPIERIVGEERDGQMRATAIELGRGDGTHVPVDHVVLAAGAVGSSALLLRTAEADGRWNTLRPFRDDRVGTGLGFNYGSGAVARFDNAFARPGHMGFQIKYVATKEPDDAFDVHLADGRTHRARFVLENAFVPPGLLSNVTPGVGKTNLDWMQSYAKLAMCATTIGSPQTGRISGDRKVRYELNEDELHINRLALASIARIYLAAGARTVGLAGIRQRSGPPNDGVLAEGFRLTQDEHGALSEAQLAARLAEVIREPEHIMLSSAHPQGGLRMNVDPSLGAVGADFRVHGVANVSVADASLFPSTIVVNPQWTVAAFAEVAATKIAASIAIDTSA
ncbi:MAG: choline dehydrogenase-like flavoprotein [Polyangiales bacterium]|jgi:choline dehydrogenase-like flavoprotein